METHVPPQRLPGLGVHEEETRQGEAALTELMPWLDYSQETDDLLRAHKRKCAVQMGMRALMLMCSTPARASMRAGKVEVHSLEGTFLVALDPLGGDPVEGQGVLDFYRVPASGIPIGEEFVVLLIAGKPAAALGVAEWKNAEWGLIEGLTPTPEQRGALQKVAELDARIIAEKLEYFTLLLDHLHRQRSEMLEAIYGAAASTHYHGDGDWEAAMGPLREQGFYEILGGGAAVRGFTRLGAVASNWAEEKQISHAFPDREDAVLALLDRLERIEKETGFVLVAGDRKGAVTLI